MSTPVSPLRPSASALRRASWSGSDMRVGDAERAAVADRLAKHFGDGRLDQAEFNDRLDKAMRAKTMADLTGLLSDLPETEPVQVAPGGRRHQRKVLRTQLERERLQLRHERRQYRHAERAQRWRTLRWIPLFVAVMITGVVVAHAIMHSIIAWIVIGLIAFVWLRRNSGGYRGS